MANRPIIDIQVQDEAFKQFYAIFEQFTNKVEEQPAAWAKLGESMKAAGDGFGSGAMSAEEAMAAIMGTAVAVSEELHNAMKNQEGWNKATKDTHESLGKVDKVLGCIGKSMKEIGKFAIGFGMLGALGAFFALPDMARNAMNRGRSAAGMNVTPGEQGAFDTSMAPVLGDPKAFLQHIALMQQSPSGVIALSRLTHQPITSISGEDTDVLASRAVKGLHEFGRHHKGDLLSPALQGILLGQFSSHEALGLGNRSDTTINRAVSGATNPHLIPQFAQSHAQTRINAAAAVRFSQNWKTLEMSMMRALTPVMPELARYATELTGTVQTLLLDVFSPKNVAILKQDIGEFVHFLGSPAFMTDMQNFGKALEDMTTVILDMAHPLKSAKQAAKSLTVKGTRDYVTNTLFGGTMNLPSFSAYEKRKDEQHKADMLKHTKAIANAHTKPRAPAPYRHGQHNPMASDIMNQAHNAR
jgi:hypothetical protein